VQCADALFKIAISSILDPTPVICWVPTDVGQTVVVNQSVLRTLIGHHIGLDDFEFGDPPGLIAGCRVTPVAVGQSKISCTPNQNSRLAHSRHSRHSRHSGQGWRREATMTRAQAEVVGSVGERGCREFVDLAGWSHQQYPFLRANDCIFFTLIVCSARTGKQAGPGVGSVLSCWGPGKTQGGVRAGGAAIEVPVRYGLRIVVDL